MSELFQRLKIGVRRSYSLIISTGVHRYFLGTFYITPRDGKFVEKDSELLRKLKAELYNTQILSIFSFTYKNFVPEHIMTGEEASLTNAFIAFCHTTSTHNQPDRFDLEEVKSAFHSDPDMTSKLIKIFRNRFDPDMKDRGERYEKDEDDILQAIQGYNTGHRHLDEIRKTFFRPCLSFINHILKTNFYS